MKSPNHLVMTAATPKNYLKKHRDPSLSKAPFDCVDRTCCDYSALGGRDLVGFTGLVDVVSFLSTFEVGEHPLCAQRRDE
jgi:hypothetical protein